MSWTRKATFLVTCVVLSLGYKASAAPLDSDKSGEDQVKDAVRKAEAAASLAAEDSLIHGHKAEARIAADKVNRLAAEIEDNSSMKEGRAAKKVNLMMKHLRKKAKESEDENEHNPFKRVKEHRVHSKPSLSHLMGMSELGDISPNTNSYKEDTKLEDRLAIEAEEEKKYEDGYGSQGWDDGPAGSSKGGSWSTNIQRQDAAEKQSIQAQVASESAHELNEIQQAVAAESQSSRGSATMGDQGATVVQVNGNEGQSARFREGEGQRPIEAGGASFEAPRVKSFESTSHQPSALAGLQSSSMPYHQSDLSSIIRQASKLSPSEMQGPPKQFSSEGMGSLSGLNIESTGGQSQGLSRYTQPESLLRGSQQLSPMMSSAFTGAEGNQMSAGSFQETEPSQREAFNTGGGLQGGMEVGNMQGGGAELGGGNTMQNMGSLSAGFNGDQQQQPLMEAGQGGLQSMVGDDRGASMMAAGGMSSLQAGVGSMGGLQSFRSMGGLQSFGGAAGAIGYKKRSKTAKAEKEDRPKGQRNEKTGIRNSKKSKLTGHHRHHHHHHHHRHHHHHNKHY